MTHRSSPKALVAVVVIALLTLAGCGSTSASTHSRYARVSVAVGSKPISRPLAPGFVGLSVEYPALTAYASPMAIRLIAALAPGQRPVLRVGGNSSDETWWPQPGQTTPRGASFALSKSWLNSVRALASALDAKLILGLNLAAGSQAVAADEAHAFLRGIGARYIEAFEIGNEPDLYGLFPWPQDHGRLRRSAHYSLNDYVREFSRWRAAVGSQIPAVGPAFATFDWSLARFIDAEPGLTTATFHHYPLDACLTNPSAKGYPTVASLLSDQASSGLARLLAPAVGAAHARGVSFRLDELNSASCGGKAGVSNTFASALWMLDTLFSLARIGVDGVNVHTFPGAAYAPFSGSHVYPEYYGMLMFTRAFPPGARLLPAKVVPSSLKAWATIDRSRRVRIVLINEDLHRAYRVQLRARGLSGTVRIERLGGGRSTASGNAITVPAGNALLVTG